MAMAASMAAVRDAALRRAREDVAGEPLLRTKVSIPDVPCWAVSRPRIDERIAEGVRGPLTVVTGPPGAGKTMAMAAWAAKNGSRPVAWVTLDGYDNQPASFWSYLVEALREAGVDVSRAAPALAQGEPMGHALLLRLAAALATNDPPAILVLDDLHLVTEPATLAGLDYVLRNARPGLRVVAASRIDPLLPLHRYRLTGDLTEIRAGDLAFSVPEAAMLMAQHGVSLPAESLELVTKRNEGWAAGLRMAAISMDGHPDPEQFVKNLAADDSAIAGYLVEEVLNAQPAAARDLLLATSICDRVNADIAGELAGDENAAGALWALAQANAFVEPIGSGWYRYHSMFADVLRLKLRRENPHRLADLHRRAARWYQRNGILADAVRHAEQAGDWPLAARIVIDELAVGQLIEPDGSAPFAETFRRMPDGQAQPQPMLASAAVALAAAADPAGEAALAAAEQSLAQLPDDQQAPSRLAAAIIRLTVARRRGDLDAAADAAARAELLLAAIAEGVRARHPGAGAQVMLGRGAVELWSGKLDTAAAILASAAAAAPRGSYEAAACHGYLALTEALRGELSRAAALAVAGALPRADRRARRLSPAAAVALAYVDVERGELTGARGRLRSAGAALRAHPDKLIGAVAYLVAARASLAEGRADVAAGMAERGRKGWSPPPWLDRMLTLAESQAHAAAGDSAAAIDAASRAGAGSSLDAAIVLARAWLVAGNIEAAGRALADRGETPPGAAEDRILLDAWLTDAHISYRRGDPARVRRSLEHALRLGERQQLRLPFAMERAWIRPALRRHPELAQAHRDLLGPGLAGPVPVPATPAAAGQPAPEVVERLSNRECDVLRLASAMLTTAEIAADLCISVNTVKTYLKSIFRKLGVAHRGEAVRRARQLDLLGPV
jgi:LuxR family transcriptional regulator, maltose regulon positive regulatory protein